MTALRIAMISEHASPLASPGSVDSGGQNVYVAHLARQLARRGHQVDVFTRRDDELPTLVPLEPRARVVHVPAGPPQSMAKESLLPFMREFARWMQVFQSRHGRYDLVHANFFMSGDVADQLWQATGVPYVITFHALGRVRMAHQGTADRFPPERIAIEQRVIRNAASVLAECPQDYEDLTRLYAADPQRVTVLPCGYDPEELFPVPREWARRRLRVPLDAFVVAQIGRMVPRKGVDDAIRGFALFVQENPRPARMLIVGGENGDPDSTVSPEMNRLQHLAETLEVSDRVEFCGRNSRTALKYYYSAADVFVTTPWYEPFGITPLEAMACGTPVVGARVGGIKYTVRDGVTGLLVPPKEPTAIAAALLRLSQDRALCERLGRQALAHVRREFTWRDVAARLERVYEKVVARHRGSTSCMVPATVMPSAAAVPQGILPGEL